MTTQSPSSDEPLEPEFTLADYGSALYRRRVIILLVAVVSALVAALVSWRLPPRYEASTAFYVPSDVEGSIGVGTEQMGARLPSGVQNHARAYAAILKHPDAWRAVKRRFPKKPLGRFSADLDIVATREGVIRIYSRDADPKLAADIANAMVEYFDEFIHGVIQTDLETSLERLNEQIELIKDKILDTTRERQGFQEEHGIASMPNNLAQVENQRLEFKHQLLDARVAETTIREQIESLDRQMEIESERYVRSQLLETREGAFHTELRERKALLEVELSGSQARISGLQEAIRTIDSTIRDYPVLATQLQGFDEELQSYRESRDSFEQTRNDLTTRSLDLRSAALVIRNARPPRSPAFPKHGLNVAVATIAGLIVGMVYALFLEGHRQRRRRQLVHNLQVEQWDSTRTQEKAHSAGQET